MAAVIFSVVMGAIYVSYSANQALFTRGERMTDLQQNARGALDLLSREIRMAGYNDFPGVAPNCNLNPGRNPNPFIIAQQNVLVIRGNVDLSQCGGAFDVFYGVQTGQAGSVCPPPLPGQPPMSCLLRGTYAGPNMGAGTYTLEGPGAAWAVVAFNIQSITFTYFNAGNNQLNPGPPPGALDGADVTVAFPALLTMNNYLLRGAVRRVVVAITAADTRGALPYGGRAPVYTLWTDINIRNLEGT